MTSQIIQGDCLEVLKTLETNSVDSIVTDPPAGIAFMGKDWDDFSNSKVSQKPAPKMQDRIDNGGCGYMKTRGTTISETVKGRDAFVAFMTEVMTEALRVIKPGGHILVWSLPRTSHWTGYAIENAGFEIRDTIDHIFGSGMPKSHNVSIAIDKYLKADRKIIGTRTNGNQGGGAHTYDDDSFTWPKEFAVTASATPEAEQWNGWGTGLKPAKETWWLARKPLAESSIAANVLEWGTGAINIDASRVGTERTTTYSAKQKFDNTYANGKGYAPPVVGKMEHSVDGRWPANVLLSHTLECVPNGTKRVKGNGAENGNILPKVQGATYAIGSVRSGITHRDSEGLEEVEAWQCAPDCPVAELDRQSGIRKGATSNSNHASSGFMDKASGTEITPGYNDQGGASRYFATFHYFSKPSKRERNNGCEALNASAVPMYGAGIGEGLHPEAPVVEKNNHPTVKSLALCRYLVRMITPPGGIVLDCFAGSGSIACACIQEGFSYIAIEKEPEYVEIIKARTSYCEQQEHTEQHVQTWECADDCPVAELDRQSGTLKSGALTRTIGQPTKNHEVFGAHVRQTHYERDASEGGASRFFAQLSPDSVNLPLLFAQQEPDCMEAG
jgi:DNA modification methylase